LTWLHFGIEGIYALLLTERGGKKGDRQGGNWIKKITLLKWEGKRKKRRRRKRIYISAIGAC